MVRRRSALVAALLGVLAGFPALAEMPYPSNPNPCPGEPDCIEATAFSDYLFLPTTVPPTLPNDFGSDNWKLTSERTGNPAIDDSAQELFGVKGASVDLAWQTTTGRPDVVIAVLDSGIQWADPLTDLVNKFYLNRNELPQPEASTNVVDPYDRNGDGAFTVKDYLADDTHAQDSRVSDQNGNGIIDPEDLIFLFSDGVDDDQNGYVDDISGWDFFEDDNDALDEVRYGHGTGESRDSNAEANNGTGGVGTCPSCLVLEVRVGDSFVTDVNAFAQAVVFAVDSGAMVVQEALGTLNQTGFGQQAIDYAYDNGVVVIASAADEESNHHNYPANYNHTVQVNSVVRFESDVNQMPQSYLYLNGCTNYGGHIALAVPSSSCSSEATGNSSGMAGLVVSAAFNAIDRGMLTAYPRDDGSTAPYPLSAEEVKQVLTMTVDDINFDARDDVDPPLPQSYATTAFIPGVDGSERFRSIAGFDQFFGYGRINADRAVQWVAAGRVPPEASIDSPAWYDIIDPEADATLSIQGRVAANRAESFMYLLEVAPGIQPAEEDFVQEAFAENQTSALAGELGRIDLDALRSRMPNGVEGSPTLPDGSPDPDRFTFTVRVRVQDNDGNVAEDRRVLALHHDPDLLPFFPRQLGSDGAASPMTADLDGDGREEIIVATSGGFINALQANGANIPGWPVSTDPLEIHAGSAGFTGGAIEFPVNGAVLGAPAVGDLDGDGWLEVVATDMQGKAYAWSHDGQLLPGFPVSTLAQYSNQRRSERDLGTPDGQVPDRTNRHDRDNRVGRALASGPVLANLDGSADGSLEIIAGAFDRHIYAWTNTGEAVPGWPLLLKDPEKVESVDPDTNEVTLIADSGARIGTKVLVPPSVGDVDGDGRLEVVAVVNEEYRESPNAVFVNEIVNIFRLAGILDMGNTRVYAIYADGAAHGDSGLDRGWNPDAFLPGWPVKTALGTTELLPIVATGSNGPPALADVDGDGRVEVATMSAVGSVYVFKGNGESFFGRAETGEDIPLTDDPYGANSNSTDQASLGALGAPVLVELGVPGQGFHVLAPASGIGKLIDNQIPARQFPADNHLTAWQVSTADGSPTDGSIAAAFPQLMNDLQFFGAPAVADIDGDGLPEAIIGSGVYDLRAFDVNGATPEGWHKFTNGWMVGTPAVGDVDGDGRLEVVATTREGYLFVWRTSGDECGNIRWRRYHHDEWGTGNYHTDARPPAFLRGEDVTDVIGLAAGSVAVTVAAMPGDDLYCGNLASIDARYSNDPIEDEESFANAMPVSMVTWTPGSRAGGSIGLQDDSLHEQSVYIALVMSDDAGNRSPLAPIGLVDFPGDATPTATSTPTLTFTPTATSVATSTPAATATSPGIDTPGPTRTIAPTTRPTNVPPPTPGFGPEDDSCNIAAQVDVRTPWWMLLPIGALVAVRRRQSRR
jgi:hypothetical protein